MTNAKAYFQSYNEAKAFFDTKKGAKAIGSVRKELRSELGNWIVQYTEKTTKTAKVVTEVAPVMSKEESKLEEVYQALLKCEEGGGYVYLDNVNLKALGITEQQFSGYCAALTKQGRYQPTSDKAFGIVVIKQA